MNYIMEIESRIAGIPCIVGVHSFSSIRGSRNAPSDVDYYGYTETEWDVLDRRGRPAPWLEKKLDDAMRDEIEQEIVQYLGDR